MTVAESATKTKGKRVIQEETKAHEFGVCGQCYAHLRLLTPPGQRTNLAMPGAWAAFEARATPDEMSRYISLRKPSCEAADVFADFETWEGSVRSFRFDSRRYAERFRTVNLIRDRNVVSFDLEAAPPPAQPFIPEPPPALAYMPGPATLAGQPTAQTQSAVSALFGKLLRGAGLAVLVLIALLITGFFLFAIFGDGSSQSTVQPAHSAPSEQSPSEASSSAPGQDPQQPRPHRRRQHRRSQPQPQTEPKPDTPSQ